MVPVRMAGPTYALLRAGCPVDANHLIAIGSAATSIGPGGRAAARGELASLEAALPVGDRLLDPLWCLLPTPAVVTLVIRMAGPAGAAHLPCTLVLRDHARRIAATPVLLSDNRDGSKGGEGYEGGSHGNCPRVAATRSDEHE